MPKGTDRSISKFLLNLNQLGWKFNILQEMIAHAVEFTCFFNISGELI